MFVSLYFRIVKYKPTYVPAIRSLVDVVTESLHDRQKTIEAYDSIEARRIKDDLLKKHKQYMWKRGNTRGFIIKTETFPGEKGRYFRTVNDDLDF